MNLDSGFRRNDGKNCASHLSPADQNPRVRLRSQQCFIQIHPFMTTLSSSVAGGSFLYQEADPSPIELCWSHELTNGVKGN